MEFPKPVAQASDEELDALVEGFGPQPVEEAVEFLFDADETQQWGEEAMPPQKETT